MNARYKRKRLTEEQLEREGRRCPACEGPGFWSETCPLPGILARISGNRAKRLAVERCDECERYASDDDARKALEEYGVTLL